MTDCYQCVKEFEKEPEKIKPALEGPLFPFCSEEHKEKYGNEHYGKRRPEGKARTIAEIQHIILTKWRANAKPAEYQDESEIFEK